MLIFSDKPPICVDALSLAVLNNDEAELARLLTSLSMAAIGALTQKQSELGARVGSPLHIAAREGSSGCALMLLGYFNPAEIGEWGLSALSLAIRHGRSDTAMALIERGGLNHGPDYTLGALQTAARMGDFPPLSNLNAAWRSMERPKTRA